MDLAFILELAGFFLTLMVLLYLFIGDNALFRIVSYTFVGVASAYVLVTVIFQVLLPRLSFLIFSGDIGQVVMGGVVLVLGIFVLLKLWPRLSTLGSIPMAILVGIGAGVAVGGAVFGTLAGQMAGTIGLFSLKTGGDLPGQLAQGVFMLVGAISTLAYFQFSTRSRVAAAPGETAIARRAGWLELLAKLGQVFIGITLGAMFAGVYTAAISALIERISFVIGVVMKFI